MSSLGLRQQHLSFKNSLTFCILGNLPSPGMGERARARPLVVPRAASCLQWEHCTGPMLYSLEQRHPDWQVQASVLGLALLRPDPGRSRPASLFRAGGLKGASSKLWPSWGGDCGRLGPTTSCRCTASWLDTAAPARSDPAATPSPAASPAPTATVAGTTGHYWGCSRRPRALEGRLSWRMGKEMCRATSRLGSLTVNF